MGKADALMLAYQKKLRESAYKFQQRYELEQELGIPTSEKITQQFINEEAAIIMSKYVDSKIAQATEGMLGG